MPVQIQIPTPLRSYTDGNATIEVTGNNIGEVLKQLVETHSELKQHIMKDDGELRNFVNVYVNDEDIRHLAKEETPVKDGDTITIVPSIAGGVHGVIQ